MKKYRINESELFNLESMYEHLMVRVEEMKYDNAEWDDSIFDRIEEVEGLMDKTHGVGSLVDWPTLKRIREIQAERQMIRYNTCMLAGAKEEDASISFQL